MMHVNVQPRKPKKAGSARGLFGAMGKEAKRRVARDPDDFYPTLPEPVRAILAAESDLFARQSVIWEPSCGNGAMVREIEAAGHACIASDLVKRWTGDPGWEVRDFLSIEEAPDNCLLFTNPPFHLCSQDRTGAPFIWHAMDRLKVSAMILLLPISWPGAAAQGKIWAKYPPVREWTCRWRIDFTGQKQQPTNHAWYVWERGFQGYTEKRFLDQRTDVRQEVLL